MLEHYARAVWIDAPLDGEVSAGIRVKGDGISSEDVRQLVERVHAALDQQRSGLEGGIATGWCSCRKQGAR
ncbi:hypothetical protein [Streptomyces sp. NPDC003697]